MVNQSMAEFQEVGVAFRNFYVAQKASQREKLNAAMALKTILEVGPTILLQLSCCGLTFNKL